MKPKLNFSVMVGVSTRHRDMRPAKRYYPWKDTYLINIYQNDGLADFGRFLEFVYRFITYFKPWYVRKPKLNVILIWFVPASIIGSSRILIWLLSIDQRIIIMSVAVSVSTHKNEPNSSTLNIILSDKSLTIYTMIKFFNHDTILKQKNHPQKFDYEKHLEKHDANKGLTVCTCATSAGLPIKPKNYKCMY